MSEKLKRRVGKLIAVAAALVAVTIFVLSGTAQAQQDGATDLLEEDTLSSANHNADDVAIPQPVSEQPALLRLVVPGDSLWTIAQEHLGPEAAPQHVANEVERIFELNRHQIGDDPNLILVGQQLLLPAVAEPTASTMPAAAESAVAPPVAAEPEVAVPVAAAGPTLTEEPMLAHQPAVEPAVVVEQPLAPAMDEPVVLPDLPEVEAVPLAETVNPSTEPNNDANKRRLLGLGFFLLSLGAAVLLVRQLLARAPRQRKAVGLHWHQPSSSSMAPTRGKVGGSRWRKRSSSMVRRKR